MLASVLSEKKSKNVSNFFYKKNIETQQPSNQSSKQSINKEVRFLMDQIEEEANTISRLLFDIFWYLFDVIGLYKSTSEERNSSEIKDMKEVIINFMFFKDSALLTVSLNLVRVLNSEAHNHFIEKKEALKLTPDHLILNSNIMREIMKLTQVEIHFKEGKSMAHKYLCEKLVPHLKQPCTSFEDVLERLKLFASQLEDLPSKDHFYLLCWVDILEEWVLQIGKKKSKLMARSSSFT